MATIAETQQALSDALGDAIHSSWLERFSASQREELLHDDQFAATSIALILLSIFTIGLLLSAAAVWLSA